MFLNSWGIFHFIIIYQSFNILLNPAYILLILVILHQKPPVRFAYNFMLF